MPEYQRCRYCGGTGFVNVTWLKKKVCEKCKGTGRLELGK